ncbi:hypothetical protein GF420_04215 [candidate division GN15 bacterium]|nr:hypothetical protein [candidate division GN15 bacterium]
MRIPFIAFAIAVSLLLFLACGTTKNPVDSSRTGRPDSYQGPSIPVVVLEPEDFISFDSTWNDSLYDPPVFEPPDTGYNEPVILPPDGWPPPDRP